MFRHPQDTVRVFLCVVSLSLTIAGSISASIRLPRSSFKVILSGSSDCPAVIINEHHHFTTVTHNEHANSSCVVRHGARQVSPEMPYEINSIYPMTWNALIEKYLQPMSENWTVRPPSFLRYLCLMGFRAMYFSIDRKVSIISWRLPWRVLRHWSQVRPLSFDHPNHACADFAYVINVRAMLVYLAKDISYLLIADVFITRRFPSVGILRIGHVSFDSKLSMHASLVSVPWQQCLVLISWSRTKDIRWDHTSVPSESSVSIILQSCHVHVRKVILPDDQSEQSLFSTPSASVIFSSKTASNGRLAVDDFISQSVDLSSSWNEIVSLPIWLESPLSSCLSPSYQDAQGTRNSVREIFDLKKSSTMSTNLNAQFTENALLRKGSPILSYEWTKHYWIYHQSFMKYCTTSLAHNNIIKYINIVCQSIHNESMIFYVGIMSSIYPIEG